MKKMLKAIYISLALVLISSTLISCSNSASSDSDLGAGKVNDNSTDPFFGTSWYQNGKKVLEFKINEKYGVKQCYCYENITTDKNKWINPFISSAYTVISDGSTYTAAFITPFEFKISSKDASTGSFTYKNEDWGTGTLTKQ